MRHAACARRRGLPLSERASCGQLTQPPLPSPTRRSGAKYKRLRARREAEAVLPKYDPFLLQSINFP